TTAPISPARLPFDIGGFAAGSPPSDIASGDAGAAETGHNLVVDGAGGAGPVVGGRVARVARPEQDHLVAFGDCGVAHIHDELVHADAAGDLVPLPVDLH